MQAGRRRASARRRPYTSRGEHGSSPLGQPAQEALVLLLPRRCLLLHPLHAIAVGGGDVLAIVRFDHVAHVGHLQGWLGR